MNTKSLEQFSPEELGKLFPIFLTEYNSEWPVLYEKEKTIVENVIGKENIIHIDHIGSTAIQGLAAKPTIDILIQITESLNKEFTIETIKSIGYNYIYRPENPPPHMMFVKGYNLQGFQGQAYHIHVRFKSNWDEIYFRDYLIRHPEIAKEYAKLKMQLAENYKNDREAYTEGKKEFVERINVLARK